MMLTPEEEDAITFKHVCEIDYYMRDNICVFVLIYLDVSMHNSLQSYNLFLSVLWFVAVLPLFIESLFVTCHQCQC